MSFKPLLIAPIKSGVQENVDSWMIPEDAFIHLDNAFIEQGRVRKKPLYELLGRLAKAVTAESLGVAPGPTYSGTLAQVGIVPGSLIITDGVKTATDDGTCGFSGDVTAGTINYATGAYSITFDGATVAAVEADYSWYPMLPCMGLHTYEKAAVNYEDTIAFDTTASYIFDSASTQFTHITGAAVPNDNVWSSNNSQFFSTCNHWYDASNNRLFWAVNGKAQNTNKDGIKFYNGTQWEALRPVINAAGAFLEGASVIIPYKNMLFVMNTIENGGAAVNYGNRVRWCQNGTPLISVEADAWRQDINGKGGNWDIATTEVITGAKEYMGNIIIFCERSVFLMKFTGETELPIRIIKISDVYGSEGINGPVVDEKGCFFIGNENIAAFNGTKVAPIDEAIPRFVTDEINNDNEAVNRLASIRDSYYKSILWSYPGVQNDPTFPNKVLVMNTDNGAFSRWNDSFTCYGKYQNNVDLTWEKAKFSWESSSRTWAGGSQSRRPEIIAGNQQGFVVRLDKETLFNDTSLAITAIDISTKAFTIPNHNLDVGQYLWFYLVNGISGLNTETAMRVTEVVDSDNIIIETTNTLTGAYTGGGLVSIIQNFRIQTKKLNLLKQTGTNVRISYIDVLLDRTFSGTASLDVYTNNNLTQPAITKIFSTQTIKNDTENYEWHRIPINTTAQSVSLRFYLNEEQLASVESSFNSFVIHATNIWVKPAGRIVK